MFFEIINGFKNTVRISDKWVAYLCGGILCLMAIGHAFAFVSMSKSLGATSIDRDLGDAIRAVWLTISVMFASFGLLLVRAARQKIRADWLSIASIGVVLLLAGSAGLGVSAGQPFWWQHIVLGLAILTVGWRSRHFVEQTRRA